MGKNFAALFFLFFLWIFTIGVKTSSASHVACRKPAVLTAIPANDTVFQIDTVFQYEYVYDTIYYYDTIRQPDTVTTVFDSIKESDSTIIVNRTIEMVVTENKTVYIDKYNIPQEFIQREFRQKNESVKPEMDFEPTETDQNNPVINKQKQIRVNSQLPVSEFIFLSSRSRDTLYRYDTVYKFRTSYDTVKFERKVRSDTVISSHTTYEDFGRSVLVKETVTVKVTERKDIFSENTSIWSSDHASGRKSKSSRKSGTIAYSKYKNSFEHTPRVGDDHTFTGNLRVGFSFFKPDIHYSARSLDFSDEVEKMNQNHYPDNSYGLSFTYQYIRDKFGIESGLGFTEQNYSYDYFYQQMLTDSSSYWDYYQKEIYQFDTIWYLDLDALLQTGDTIFIPNVDSALTFVTDSIQKFKVDTLFENRNSKYHYSFSFLEVPIIGHYTLINQKFYLQISGGIIPMFMISKTGTITYPETGPVINANQISFDYGFMLSVYGSATFGYMFSKRWSIFAEPYFKRNVFSLIQNDDIHVKTNSWGLKAGLTFRLFLFKSK